MADWTTRVISDSVEIDLHPDLDSFPAQIRSRQPYGDQVQGIILSKKEVHDLMFELIDYFGGVYSSGG